MRRKIESNKYIPNQLKQKSDELMAAALIAKTNLEATKNEATKNSNGMKIFKNINTNTDTLPLSDNMNNIKDKSILGNYKKQKIIM